MTVLEPVAGTDEDGWRRLDRRTILVTSLVTASVAAGVCLPVLLGLSGGARSGSGARFGIGVVLLLTGAVLLVLAGAGLEYVRWTRTRYRVGSERMELHTGLLLLKRRALARERIRTVDLTANPLLRVLGLVNVRIGTGENAGAGESVLEFKSVTREEGERLRRELLARGATDPGVRREGVLVSLDPSWIRYAPVSFVAPLLGGAAIGGVMQVSEWFGVQGEVIHWVGQHFRDTPVVWMVAVLVIAAGAAGVIGALGLWIEMWWNYRLEREPGGTLRVRRGLLTARSISIEERRLRGVELVEPLGVRLFGAARVDAIATGLVDADDDKHADLKALLPPAPRAVADELAAQVLRESVAPTGAASLRAHPRAARTRRLRWALAAALLPVTVVAGLGLWLTPVLLYLAAVCVVMGVPIAVILALDAYRSLGHGISDAYLVTRSGTVRRATVALQRGGVIGWVVRQSVFQRRAGVLTLTATTAAGAGAYSVYDAGESEGLVFGADAVPGLLEPFLLREPAPDGLRDAGRDGTSDGVRSG
jgi:putative membrane protein